jgi:hypothetical protein
LTLRLQSFHRSHGGGKYARMRHAQLLKELPGTLLADLYFRDKQSTNQIAERFGISQSAIYNLFKTYGMKTRTLREAMDLKKKPLTRFKRVRLRVLRLLGGACVHCGCDDPRVLEVHHKAGGGARERKEVGGDGFWYNIVMGRRRTDDLELCCKPCHVVEDIKRLYGVENFRIEWRRS